jgi:hypothetical protein
MVAPEDRLEATDGPEVDAKVKSAPVFDKENGVVDVFGDSITLVIEPEKAGAPTCPSRSTMSRTEGGSICSIDTHAELVSGTSGTPELERSEASTCRYDICRLIGAILTVLTSTGWLFGWPSIRYMLESSDMFQKVRDKRAVYVALFTLAVASLDAGRMLAGWTIARRGPRFCAVYGGTASAVAMALASVAIRFADFRNFTWLVFPAFSLQAVAGMHMFTAALSFEHIVPRRSSLIIGMLLCALTCGGSFSQWQLKLLKACGEVNSESVQGIFLAQAGWYLVMAYMCMVIYRKDSYQKPETSEKLESQAVDTQGIVQRPGFIALSMLAMAIGCHVRWILGAFDYILQDRSSASMARAQYMSDDFFAWSPIFLVAAYMVAYSLHHFLGPSIMLVVLCIVSIAQASVNIAGSFDVQYATFALLPFCWQLLYITVTQVLGILFPRSADAAKAFELLMAFQGCATLSLNGFNALASSNGYTVSNTIFAVLAGLGLLGTSIVVCRRSCTHPTIDSSPKEKTAGRDYKQTIGAQPGSKDDRVVGA